MTSAIFLRDVACYAVATSRQQCRRYKYCAKTKNTTLRIHHVLHCRFFAENFTYFSITLLLHSNIWQVYDWGRDRAVAHHFRAEDHDIEDVRFKVMELITDKSRYYRQIRELVWIEKLNTEVPEGLNKKANLGVLWREYK